MMFGLKVTTENGHFIMSTLRQSQPNKAGLKCPSVHVYVVGTYVCPQYVPLILMTFGM